MSNVHPDPQALDTTAIRQHIQSLVAIVGSKWINRKVREHRSRKPPTAASMQKYSYLFTPPTHTLIDNFLEFENWREECKRTRRREPSQAVIKLAMLGNWLALVKSMKHFQRLVSRLKNMNHFESAAFEAEVAAGYARDGCEVEFIEEGTEKTPDLKVSPMHAPVFYVECKRRDSLTERDRKIATVWTELEARLLRLLGPQRLNYLIVVKANSDPVVGDVEYLYQLIVRSFESGGIGRLDYRTKTVLTVSDPSERFHLAVQKLAEPDQVIETNWIELRGKEDFDRVILGCESKNEGGKSFVRNPVMICLKTAIAPDRVSGIVDALRSATGQLPEGGPGIVWIRVADNLWRKEIDESFERARKLIREQLTGNWNRRVNAVFIMTRMFRDLEKDGLRGLAYSPLIVRIDHDNPATPHFSIR